MPIKRWGGVQRLAHSTAINLDAIPALESESRELLALDEALGELARMDSRKARVVELRFFGGLSVEETAEVMKISPQTVMRDWKASKVFLGREVRGGKF